MTERMKRSTLSAIVVILAMILTFSCENTGVFGVNCDECYSVEPDSADLVIYLTINSENPYVPIKLYRGNIENKELDWVDTAMTKEYKLYSAVDQDYSVEAYYKSGGKTVIAVDGDKITTSLVTDVCDNDCWIIKGGVLNARLKNE
jgi:hypothetical protein